MQLRGGLWQKPEKAGGTQNVPPRALTVSRKDPAYRDFWNLPEVRRRFLRRFG